MPSATPDPHSPRGFRPPHRSFLNGNTPAPLDDDPLWVELGLGVLCAEAQADGFPCDAPDTDCDACEHALRPRRRHHA